MKRWDLENKKVPFQAPSSAPLIHHFSDWQTWLSKTQKGKRGELLVASKLRAWDWQLCHWRWRTPWAEVDLVFRKKRHLLLVEVKCLASLEHLSTAVSQSQKRRLQRAVENLAELDSVDQVECVLAVVLPNQGVHWFVDFLSE